MDLPGTFALEDQIVVAIRRIIRAVELHSQSLVASVGLTSPQVAVLKMVGAMPEVTPTALARALKLSQATVSGIVDRLTHRGLVERTRVDGDKRKHAVRLTADGVRALAGAPSLLQERFRAELERLESWEQTMLLSSLQRIAALMDVESVTAAALLTPGAEAAADYMHDRASSRSTSNNEVSKNGVEHEP